MRISGPEAISGVRLDLNLGSDDTLSAPDIVSLDRSSDGPQHAQDDLNNQNGSSLRASVGTKGVECAPAAVKAAADKVKKPKEGEDPADRKSRVPQQEESVLVGEAVHELGHH